VLLLPLPLPPLFLRERRTRSYFCIGPPDPMFLGSLIL